MSGFGALYRLGVMDNTNPHLWGTCKCPCHPKGDPGMTTTFYRQGDVLIIPVATTPTNTKPVNRENGLVILAHGEATGHHHAIADKAVELVTTEQANELRMWLTITAPEPVALTHQEHDTIMLPPGQYEVRRQREYSPGAIRRVQD